MDPWSFRRISVRVLENSQARDVIGRVIWRTSDEVRLMRRDGALETIRIAAIIAAREVPDDPGRLRPAEQFDVAKLESMVRAHDPRADAGLSIAVMDLRPASVGAPNWPDEPNDDWWAAAPPNWRDLAGKWQEPELKAFCVSDGACCRIVLAGDWCGLSIASRPDSSPESIGVLATEAFAWAHARGAAYAWTLVDGRNESERLNTLHLGFAVVT